MTRCKYIFNVRIVNKKYLKIAVLTMIFGVVSVMNAATARMEMTQYQIDNALLIERREQIAGRQADIRDESAVQATHGAADVEMTEAKTLSEMVTVLPTTGKRDFAIIVSVSAACGLVSFGVKKLRKSA